MAYSMCSSTPNSLLTLWGTDLASVLRPFQVCDSQAPCHQMVSLPLSFCHMVGITKTRSYVQVAVKLLDLVGKLMDWNPIGLLQSITDVETFCFCCVIMEHGE
jgi:hypothetical protein